MLRSLFLPLLGGVLSACQMAGDDPPHHVEVMKGDEARALHQDLLSRTAAGFTGAVIVEREDTVILSAGYGWANREERRPFTPHTIAQIGSLSKQFTAMAVVDLRERGMIQFTDSLGDFFPSLSSRSAAITIHQLLTHTAGLPEYCGNDFDRVTREAFLASCLSDSVLTERGGHYAYSNPGYSALAAVVEQVSGRTLGEYLRERLLSPLDLQSVGYLFSRQARGQHAVGYVNGVAQPLISDRLRSLEGAHWNLTGNGGMQASATDMYRWYRALSRGPVVSDDMRGVALRPHVARDSTVSYGYGWFIRTEPNGRIAQVSHSGSDGTFMSVFVWRPQEHLFLYVVGSTGEGPPVEVARAILGTFRPAGEGVSSPEQTAPRRPPA